MFALSASARESRLRTYWLQLFRSEAGFPDVALLTAADALRFEARLTNLQNKSLHRRSGWLCLSCLRPSPMRFGGFCVDCVDDEAAFVAGGGGHMMADVSCGHAPLVYFCPLCEAAACRSCLMGGACTMCLLLAADTPACGPCDLE